MTPTFIKVFAALSAAFGIGLSTPAYTQVSAPAPGEQIHPVRGAPGPVMGVGGLPLVALG